MKLTPQEQKLFEGMRGSSTGIILMNYLERAVAHACDSRSWGENEDKTHANRVAKFISEELVVHLRDKRTSENSEMSEFE